MTTPSSRVWLTCFFTRGKVCKHPNPSTPDDLNSSIRHSCIRTPMPPEGNMPRTRPFNPPPHPPKPYPTPLQDIATKTPLEYIQSLLPAEVLNPPKGAKRGLKRSTIAKDKGGKDKDKGGAGDGDEDEDEDEEADGKDRCAVS